MTTLSPPPAHLVTYAPFEYELGKLLVSVLRPHSMYHLRSGATQKNFQVRVRDSKFETPLSGL